VAETEQLMAAEPQSLAEGVIQLDNNFVDTGTNWVNTLSSYTVVAEVRLDSSGTPAAILSQDGGITSNFALEYTGETFAFTLFDAFGKSPVRAVGTLTPEAGRWYQLVGVRDLRAGTFSLYVDGELQAQGEFADVWSAKGSTIIGAARAGSKRVNMLTGAVKGVRIYNGALTDTEINELPASTTS
jgi:hypothetical protein